MGECGLVRSGGTRHLLSITLGEGGVQGKKRGQQFMFGLEEMSTLWSKVKSAKRNTPGHQK